jgi:hypothetical protein
MLAGNIPFTPTALSDLVAWYDADDLGSIAVSGSDVTQWNDKSGNARHATQGTSTNRPKSGTRTINGKNVIDFDGSNDFLVNNAVAPFFSGDDKPFTVFMAGNTEATSRTAWMFGRSVSGTPYLWQYNSSMQFRDDSNGTSSLTFTGSDTSGNQITTWRSSGLNFTGWLKKVLINSGSAYNRTNITLDWSTIGAYRTSAATDFYFDGMIGEIIYYSRQLTTDEVSLVQDYLSAKWEIV